MSEKKLLPRRSLPGAETLNGKPSRTMMLKSQEKFMICYLYVAVKMIFAKVCFAQCSTSRLALGSPGWLVGCHHARNSIYANIYRF